MSSATSRGSGRKRGTSRDGHERLHVESAVGNIEGAQAAEHFHSIGIDAYLFPRFPQRGIEQTFAFLSGAPREAHLSLVSARSLASERERKAERSAAGV